MVIRRRSGTTPTEKYLQQLCEKSFLRLWSYPALFQNQGLSQRGEGRELCDLLVVFGSSVLIFSDKHCEFPSTGDIRIDWNRWFRKAVYKSARQVIGAERWLSQHPNRLFLDKRCKEPFPLAIPSHRELKIHRIVVAHGVAERCRAELGGTGSLMIMNRIKGKSHFSKDSLPFVIGDVFPESGFVHVLDDSSLEKVLSYLDTIADFVAYLEKKERFLRSDFLVSCASEEDLLAYYLQRLNKQGDHDFVVKKDVNAIMIDDGFWDDFLRSEHYAAKVKSDRISYAWDRLIEKFSEHLMQGTLRSPSGSGLSEQEMILRYLASEPRTKRRMLAEAFLDIIQDTPKNSWRVRGVESLNPSEPHYVFLSVSSGGDAPSRDDFKARRTLLEGYCLVHKLKRPHAETVIGLATEASDLSGTSRTEDAILVNHETWNEEARHRAREFRDEMGLLRKVKRYGATDHEFPVSMPKAKPIIGQSSFPRNKPCPCKSGLKFKKCCGK